MKQTIQIWQLGGLESRNKFQAQEKAKLVLVVYCWDIKGTHYQNLHSSCISWVWLKQEKCITGLNISTCPAYKTTLQRDRTRGLFADWTYSIDNIVSITFRTGTFPLVLSAFRLSGFGYRTSGNLISVLKLYCIFDRRQVKARGMQVLFNNIADRALCAFTSQTSFLKAGQVAFEVLWWPENIV